MSDSIDRRVVEMRFDNKDFEQNAGVTLLTLDKLKDKLSFSGAEKSLKGVSDAAKSTNFNGLSSAVETVHAKFSALEVMAITALTNITNSAVNAGKKLVSAFTIDPIKTGFQEYETQINAVQTILANTSSKGTTLKDVNKALDELNKYADKTIYNFTEMTRNIGTFTAAGIDLKTSVSAIQGIANLAAVSGSNAQQASTAMYQLSQALASGTVKLQDWNSVVNAGMGGEVFQNALKETARLHGVAVDEMIKNNGSFRESLKEGWITADILTETLKKFTVSGVNEYLAKNSDLTKKQINNMRESADASEDWEKAYHDMAKSIAKHSDLTEDQIFEYLKMSKTAEDAATKVKTFTQLMDTLKEAAQSGWTQTWEILIGDFNEAKGMFTGISDALSKVINASAEARNTVLQKWKDLGGRDDIAKGVKTALGAIGKAFKEAFPAKTTEQLDAIANKLKSFTEGFAERMKIFERWQPYFTDILKAGSDVVNALKDAFAGLFDVLGGSGGESAVEALLTSFISLIAFISRGISALIEFGRETGIFKIVQGLLREVNDLLFGLIDTAYDFADSLTDAFEKIPKPIADLGDSIDKAFEFFDENKVKVIDVMANAMGKLFSLIGKGLSKIDLGKVGAFLAGSGILMAGKKLADVLGGLKIKFDDILELPKSLGSLKKTLGGLSDTLNDFQTSVKVKTLTTIAIAIGILAAACIGLSTVSPKKLAASVAAVGGLFTELGASSYLIKGKGVKGIISMSLAIVILSRAVKALSEVENMGQGLIGVGVLLAELGAFCFTFDRLKIRPKALKRTANGLILMAVAINLLAKPVKELGAMNTDQLIQGLLALAAMLSGFTLTALAFSKIKTRGLVKAGAAMVVMAVAMNILVKPLSELGAMDLTKLQNGLGGMAVALTEIAGFTAVMSMIASSSGNIMKAGAALLLMSVGIKIMAGALDQMGANAKAGKGLSVMFGSLVILAGAMALMQNSLGGAAAMIIVAGALTIMAPAIALLSSLPMLGVAVGMAALAGTLIIFATLSGLLSPMIPVMLALTGALALLGVAVAGIGAGLMLMVGAFLMAAGPVTKGAEKLAQAFPIVAQGIGDGLIVIIKTIGESASAIKETLFKLVDAILSVFTDIIPDIVDAGIQFIMALLQGINSSSEQIASTAVSIITNFINGISAKMPALVDAGFNLIVTFLNSMADAISKNGDKLANALANVILAALGAVVGLIPGFGKKGKAMIDSYRQGLVSGKKPTETTAKTIATGVEKGLKIKDQKSNGANAVKGLKNGLESMKSSLSATANKIADIVDKVIRKKNQIKSPSRRLYQTGSYLMQGLIGGVDSLTGTYEKKADNIATMMISSANKSVDSVNSIFSNGFSDGFDLNNSITKAVDVSLSMGNIVDKNAELSNRLAKLTSSLDGMTESMNSRSLNNYITVDGASDPELFADELINSFRLNARTV